MDDRRQSNGVGLAAVPVRGSHRKAAARLRGHTGGLGAIRDVVVGWKEVHPVTQAREVLGTGSGPDVLETRAGRGLYSVSFQSGVGMGRGRAGPVSTSF
jgi:hypothetical protein